MDRPVVICSVMRRPVHAAGNSRWVEGLWDDSAKSSLVSGLGGVTPEGPHRAPRPARATENGAGIRLWALGLGSLLPEPPNTRQDRHSPGRLLTWLAGVWWLSVPGGGGYGGWVI